MENPFHIKFEQEISKWFDFRRSLREPDRSNFDLLMEKARVHKEAGKHKPTYLLTNIIIMNILIENQKEISHLQNKIKK